MLPRRRGRGCWPGGDEAQAGRRFVAACLDVFGIDHAFDHPEELLELSAREEEGYATAADAQQVFAERAAALWNELAAKSRR